MKICIQPKELRDKTLPYPFFIDKKGLVGRQDFWKGKPCRLVGFNPKKASGVMKGTIGFEEFWKNPERCIGMYPIFEHEDGEYYTYGFKISNYSIS